MRLPDIITRNSRPVVMLTAMCAGVLLHKPLSVVDSATGFWIAPSLIFAMLFVTFCQVKLSQMRLSWMHAILLAVQLVSSLLLYYMLLPVAGENVAQGAMICSLAPIAMGAVVIGGLLGANVSSIASYSLFCNFAIAVIAPYILSVLGNGECTFAVIIGRVAPLLILPFMMAQIFRVVWQRGAEWVAQHSSVSFYFWLISMAITLSRTSGFIFENAQGGAQGEELILILIALVCCVAQFGVGRIIGHLFGSATTGGQSLGQKNTVLAVWLAHSFLNPMSAIAPTAYIVWQNLVNSLQIYLHDRRKS